MWGTIREILTSDGAQWHETLPFVVGFLFVAIEIVVRLLRRRRPVLDVPALAYVLGEGMAVTIMLVYGLALAFSKSLALSIADKNSKVLAIAMLVSFGTLANHIYHRWFARDRDHE